MELRIEENKVTRVPTKESYKRGSLQRENSEALQSVPLEYSTEILISASVWGDYPRPKESPEWIRGHSASHPHRDENIVPIPSTQTRKSHDSWRIW